MMPEPSLTPEEKLLRIIESSPSSGGHGQRPQRQTQDLKVTFGVFKTLYSEAAKKFVNFRVINTALVTLCAAATILLVLDYVFGAPKAASVLEMEVLAKKEGVGDLSVGGLGPQAAYLSEITTNNIFALPEIEEEGPVSEESISSEVLTGMIQQYKVVGIIWSEAPQAIVENASTGKTQLVNRGSSLEKTRVKEIMRDRVILSYGGREIELK